MDSRSRPPASAAPPAELAAPAPGADLALAPEAEPGALARLGRLLPGVEALVRFAYRTAAVSAGAALVIVFALAEAVGGLPVWLLLLGAVLLLPASGTALAGWTLSDVASIPGQLREAALAATGRSGAPAKGSRVVRLLKALWAARGVALLSKGAWMKAVGAVRFVRLASLPFALGLLGLVALNGVVILGGLAALVVLLV
ncbi:MAG: hypothetical protein AAF845_14505 [Bacteroidota bacterium]